LFFETMDFEAVCTMKEISVLITSRRKMILDLGCDDLKLVLRKHDGKYQATF